MTNPTIPSNAVFVEPGNTRPLYVARSKVERLFVGLAPQTLANLAHEGAGPPYSRRGKICWYRVSDIESWLTANPIQTNGGGK